eukprot:scaffold5374_cov97-Isochrysis_galbana.AAC.1
MGHQTRQPNPARNRPARNRPVGNRPAQNRPARNRSGPAGNRLAGSGPTGNRLAGSGPTGNRLAGSGPAKSFSAGVSRGRLDRSLGRGRLRSSSTTETDETGPDGADGTDETGETGVGEADETDVPAAAWAVPGLELRFGLSWSCTTDSAAPAFKGVARLGVAGTPAGEKGVLSSAPRVGGSGKTDTGEPSHVGSRKVHSPTGHVCNGNGSSATRTSTAGDGGIPPGGPAEAPSRIPPGEPAAAGSAGSRSQRRTYCSHSPSAAWRSGPVPGPGSRPPESLRSAACSDAVTDV